MEVRARLLAYLSLAFLVLVLTPAPALAVTVSPACGHANLNNPGNHYGLFKNGCLGQPQPPPPPPPPPAPAPAPAPPPAPPAVHPPPASNGGSGGVTGSLHAGAPGASGAEANSQPSIDIPSPAPLDLTAPGSIGHAAAKLAPDHWNPIWVLGWVLLLLLLAALAILAYLRRRQQAAATSAR